MFALFLVFSAMIYPLRVNPRLICLDAPVMLVGHVAVRGDIFITGSFGRWAGILFFADMRLYGLLCVQGQAGRVC